MSTKKLINKLINNLENETLDNKFNENDILYQLYIIKKRHKKENKAINNVIFNLSQKIRELEAKNNSFENKLPFEDYIKEINENFDFVKVHKCMIATNWNWYFGKDESGFDKMGIPSLETLKNEAYRLLEEAYHSECQISTAGFTAFWEDDVLQLIFTI